MIRKTVDKMRRTGLRLRDVMPGLVLLALLAFGLFAQQDVGLADNGDFVRTSEIFTRAPESGSRVWPVPESSEWRGRFSHFWIPRWDLEIQAGVPASSVVLLWIPGVIASALLTWGDAVSLPVLAVLPKLLIITFVLLVFVWIHRGDPRRGRVLVPVVGIPLVLMLTATDYVVYFTSLYQEAGSLVFLPALLAALVALSRRVTWPRMLAATVALFLLATSKSSMLYWSVLGMFLLPLAVGWNHRDRAAKLRINPAVLMFLAGLLVATFSLWHQVCKPINASDPEVNPFNSLFYGVLPLSDQPEAHLVRLGLEDAAGCVGEPAFTRQGSVCFRKVQHLMRFSNTVNTLWNEPTIMLSVLDEVAASMQDISLEYLGRYQAVDPRANATEGGDPRSSQERLLSDTHRGLWSLWTTVKFHAFPTGFPLLICLAGGLLMFALGLARPGMRREVSLVGIAVTAGCVIDMVVAFLGDGRSELIKHLVLANAQFDYALIAFGALLVLQTRFKEDPDAPP